MNKKLGFIGLGNMGFGMVSNLLKAHYTVLVNDIDKEKVNLAVGNGAKKVEDAREITANLEIVILCLPHPDISKTVIDSLSGKSTKVKTIIDTSTLTPEVSAAIYKTLKTRSINFLCTPMLGGKNAAEHKQIHFLVEGDRDVYEEYKELFNAMGMRADYLGQVPNATLAKLAYNICRYGNIAIAAEVSRFVRKYSNNTEQIYKLLAEGSLDNFGQVWKEDMNEMIVSGIPYKPSKFPQKDLTLIIELAKKEKLSNKLFEAIKGTYQSLEE